MAHDDQDHVDGWQTYSNWIDNLRNDSDIIATLDEDADFKQALLKKETNLERFKFIWENEQIRNEISKVYKTDLSDCERRVSKRIGKSPEESKRWREMGNKSFKEDKFMEALKQYTQAVRYASYPSQDGKDELLAQALANRSAA